MLSILISIILDFLMTRCWIIPLIFVIMLSSSDGFPLQVEIKSELLDGKARPAEAMSKVNKQMFFTFKFHWV